ncbi:MAG: hypothetical protein RLZZ241_533 [Bacteroidota bacterium]
MAAALVQLGFRITGSSISLSPKGREMLQEINVCPVTLGWDPVRIVSSLDLVVLEQGEDSENPEIQAARKLGIRTIQGTEMLLEMTRNKTRVVVAGNLETTQIIQIIREVLQYWDREIDYFLSSSEGDLNQIVRFTHSNDFILIKGPATIEGMPNIRLPLFNYSPNIALLTASIGDMYASNTGEGTLHSVMDAFLNNIIPGGSITYNSEILELNNAIQKLEKPIRKFPYCTPENSRSEGQTWLETPEGPMPLNLPEAFEARNLEGARWICQQMGIDAADFFEAISTITLG